jgi:hypothetical protein
MFWAQTAPAQLTFEVASVKRSAPDVRGTFPKLAERFQLAIHT